MKVRPLFVPLDALYSSGRRFLDIVKKRRDTQAAALYRRNALADCRDALDACYESVHVVWLRITNYYSYVKQSEHVAMRKHGDENMCRFF